MTTSNIDENALEFIGHLAQAPKGTRLIDQPFIDMCVNYNGTDHARFLRDLRDELVYCGGCADVIITAISSVVDQYPPETKEEQTSRREALKKKMGLS